MNSIGLFLFLTVFFMNEDRINGLACYSCQGLPSCGDSFKSTGVGMTTYNSSSALYCTKSYYYGMTLRSYSTTCTQGTDSYSTRSFYMYCCTTDYCNGKQRIESNILFITITILYLILSII